MIKRASSDNSGTGWDKNGLLNLKEWILAAEASKNIDGAAANWLGNSDESEWMDADLRTEAIGDDPVEVYWYFRKNGKKVTMENDPTGRFVGHEYVDVYCISRFGTISSIAEKVIDIHNVNRSLHIRDTTPHIKETIKKYREKSNRMADTQNTEYLENERLLYFYSDRFMSVNDTLVVHVDDARVSGDQTLSEVRGSGKASMPKLAVMESLLTALFEGLTFAAQPDEPSLP